MGNAMDAKNLRNPKSRHTFAHAFGDKAAAQVPPPAAQDIEMIAIPIEDTITRKPDRLGGQLLSQSKINE